MLSVQLANVSTRCSSHPQGKSEARCPDIHQRDTTETQRCLETRVKEHRDACNKGDAGKSAIAEHQWDQQHQVNWEGTRVLDRASRPVQHRVKEALYIQKTPTNNRLNRDERYELPGCWIVAVKKLGGGVSSSHASANRVSAWTSAPDRTYTQAQEPRL